MLLVLPTSPLGLTVVGVAGIDCLRVDAEEAGDLLDDDVEDERGQFIIALGARLCWAAVDHDAGRLSGLSGLQPGQRHLVAWDVRGSRGHFFYRELHARELLLPTDL